MNRIGWLIAGAVTGAVVRAGITLLWPSTLAEYVCTLALAALAGALLGYLGDTRSAAATFACSAAGTAASLGLAAGYAVGQLPQWFAVYLLAFPLCVATGFAAGRNGAR